MKISAQFSQIIVNEARCCPRGKKFEKILAQKSINSYYVHRDE